MPRTVGIFVFDEVEVLDFAGPFEVFSVAGRRSQLDLFSVFTVSERGQQISARNGLLVQPTYGFGNCPAMDIVVIPGGFGTRREMKNSVVLEWVARVAPMAQHVASVCTGSLVLGSAGLLDRLRATTHHLAFHELRAAAPNAAIVEDARVVDNGSLLCSSGVSAGIDMSLHLVAKLHGDDVAREAARYMEYEGRWDLASLSRPPQTTAG